MESAQRNPVNTEMSESHYRKTLRPIGRSKL